MKRPFESTQTDHVEAAQQSETTPWLQHTRWPELFRNRPLDIIAASAQQPGPLRSGRYLLGQCRDPPYGALLKPKLGYGLFSKA
ncbi:hypothetical protein MRS44_016938 [Fusarium solani]|uniref:uncharacterized protein n=1 Tax=Fusarium solani TaxID=169388 RepID=UPI0032C3EBCB|nr:hypothetical protein MRS44_016938 [Fusarium solani]